MYFDRDRGVYVRGVNSPEERKEILDAGGRERDSGDKAPPGPGGAGGERIMGLFTSSGQEIVDSEGGCFAAGTLVTMGDGTARPISKIVVGDKVLSYDVGSRAVTSQRVLATFVHPPQPLLAVFLDDGAEPLVVTRVHRTHCTGVWVAFEDLPTDATITSFDPLTGGVAGTRFSRSEALESAGAVYNLSVEGTHNYFAGGCLVHNVKKKDDDPPPIE
jgi:hypothetical protein